MEKNFKHKTKELFIAITLLIFLIPGLCATYSGICRSLEKINDQEKSYKDTGFEQASSFLAADEQLTNAADRTLLSKYLTTVNRFTDSVDNYSGKSNALSPFFLYIYGKTIDVLGKDLIDDTEQPVIRLKNGYLTYAYQYSQDTVKSAGILDFNNYLKNQNIPFIYTLPADKSDGRYAVYPKEFPYGYAEIEYDFIKYFDDNHIPYLSSREMLLSENKDFYSWFYKTDHHWNVHAGFSVAKAIALRINTEFGLPVDTEILNRTFFNTITYEKAFLGSQGKKVTHGYISPEDFEVYYPLFDTSFSIEIPSKTIDRTGSFENTLIKTEALKTGDYYKNNSYWAFLYGDSPLVRIHNLSCENGTRALMIKTSEANVVDTYLAFTVEYLDIIDPRYFNESIRTFIEKAHPEVVITCAFPSKALIDKLSDVK